MAKTQMSIVMNENFKNLLNEIQEYEMLENASQTMRFLMRFYAKYHMIPRAEHDELATKYRKFAQIKYMK